MKNVLIVLSLLMMSYNMMAQSPDAADRVNKTGKAGIDQPIEDEITPFGNTITSEDLRKHLTILASDEYEGRETGKEGNTKAATYIANEFKSYGLPAIGEDNSYYQHVSFIWSSWENVAIYADTDGKEKRFRHLYDFISFPSRNSNLPDFSTDEVVFLGYGIDDEKYSDYKGVDVRGKVLLVFKDEPVNAKGISQVTGTTELSTWSTDWSKKLRIAYQKGAKMVLIIENEIQQKLSENRRLLIEPTMGLKSDEKPETNFANSAYINTNLAKAIIGSKFKKVTRSRKKAQRKGKKSKSIVLKNNFRVVQDKKERILAADNVLGYIEGTDPKLKEELVIITAHYDHLGKKGDAIYNGADDNGSGTSSVIEVAQAFSKAKEAGVGPKRSILVMLVTGEEKGLLGSKFYVENPIFPLENTVADINVDMVGRVDEKYSDNPNYIYVIGSDRLSTELHEINETANKKYTNLTLDYTYNAEDDPNRYYYRSDHYNFAEKGIPAIFYFNGTHKDYHRTTDTVEKINFEKMEIIAKLVFYTGWELANRDKKIEVDVK